MCAKGKDKLVHGGHNGMQTYADIIQAGIIAVPDPT